MCIIFIWRQSGGNECVKYKFILAANRDELFNRPAEHAQFWKDYPHILAGNVKMNTILMCCNCVNVKIIITSMSVGYFSHKRA